jgi:hypothetical protein
VGSEGGDGGQRQAVSLIEIEPGRFVVGRRRTPVARSDLPRPYIIGDETPPLEHVDGKFYTSKAAFRAVTRAHGLTEVGNEKVGPKVRGSSNSENTRARREALKVAVAKFKAGHRPRSR